MKEYISETKGGRECAVLLPLFSLPSVDGIGRMDSAAYRLIDFLSASGFSAWQLLPLGPVGEWNSPYSSLSAFAGNPYFIDMRALIDDSLLDPEMFHLWEKEAQEHHRENLVDYEWLGPIHDSILKQAYQAFREGKSSRITQEWLKQFVADETDWLEDYVLFQSLREVHQNASFQTWPDPYRLRDPKALKKFSQKYESLLEYHRFVQALFFDQWCRLKSYAKEKNVRLIGDLQIYLSAESCECWIEPDLFGLDDQSLPTRVGGCPPDDWGDGQYWGTPVYAWENEKEKCFQLWERRLAHNYKLFDHIRIDHFRGLEAFWSIPFQHKPADGRWVCVPGYEMLDAILKKHTGLSLIAEDLGYKTKEVCEMRDSLRLPGMRVMQCGFAPWGNSENLPHNVPENCIYYFGTHDNPPINDWLREASLQDLRFAKRYVGLSEEEGYREGMIRALLASQAKTVVLQFQDLIGSFEDSRINTPGQPGSWRWRVPKHYFSDENLERLTADCHELLLCYGRSQFHERYMS